MRIAPLLALLLLAACEAGPVLGTRLVFGAGGATVRAGASGNVGGMDVIVVSPPIR